MNIPIMLTDTLKEVLVKNDINPNDYKPAYGGESIGLDLYNASGEDLYISQDKLYTDNERDITGRPIEGVQGSKVLIPTGVHMALPKGYVCFVKDRGSISKTRLMRRAGVIDPGYTGEIFVNLYGHSEIKAGEKLPVQLVVIKAETDYNVVSTDEFKKLTASSQRQTGKTGSSD